MIEVKNLVKRYGSHTAVNQLSFRVDTGKVVGFLGPNGAGKSTTMNMITGYIAPTEGQVIVDGINVEEEPEKAKKNIGYLPEIPALYPDMRVYEYLYFVAELKKVAKKERDVMVDEVMDRTKVSDVAERLIKNLSKGYKQRVGLAGAMMGYPETLILDEPTVGLDPGQIIQMRELIRELSQEHTILLSSHIMQEISAVCDEIIIINEGEMIASDTPENLTMRMASNGLHLLIKGDAAVIKNALRTVHGIKNVVYDEQIEEGTLGLTLYSVDKKDLREDVFYALAEASCPILEMHPMETSLEEAFLMLTGTISKKKTNDTKKASADSVVDGDKVEDTSVASEDELSENEQDESGMDEDFAGKADDEGQKVAEKNEDSVEEQEVEE